VLDIGEGQAGMGTDNRVADGTLTEKLSQGTRPKEALSVAATPYQRSDWAISEGG
jgi:hypothetical protein